MKISKITFNEESYNWDKEKKNNITPTVDVKDPKKDETPPEKASFFELVRLFLQSTSHSLYFCKK